MIQMYAFLVKEKLTGEMFILNLQLPDTEIMQQWHLSLLGQVLWSRKEGIFFVLGADEEAKVKWSVVSGIGEDILCRPCCGKATVSLLPHTCMRSKGYSIWSCQSICPPEIAASRRVLSIHRNWWKSVFLLLLYTQDIHYKSCVFINHTY